MGRNLNQIIADLPSDRQARIDARYREMKNEVEGLRELRQVAGKAQADIATALNIKQPSVSKIEKQTDMYLSTLRSYVQAIGGELELVVRLPSRQAIRLHRFSDVVGTVATSSKTVRRKTTSKNDRRIRKVLSAKV
jgi:transcriptional regulator with XRE-family HTH domain